MNRNSQALEKNEKKENNKQKQKKFTMHNPPEQ